MANGTGLVTDSEVVRSSQVEPDTEEIIDWKAQKSVEESRLRQLTIRTDLLRKYNPKTEAGKSDLGFVLKLIEEETSLVKNKIDFYTKRIQHAYEVLAIKRIVSSS